MNLNIECFGLWSTCNKIYWPFSKHHVVYRSRLWVLDNCKSWHIVLCSQTLCMWVHLHLC